MRLTIDTVTSDTNLPERVDVAIIGGGIIGVCTAWQLAKQGVSVAVFEKGAVANEQSCRNWGFCRQQGRDLNELPLIKESMALWRDMDEAINERSGFQTVGSLYLAKDDEAAGSYERWLQSAADYGLDTCLINTAQVKELFPGLKHPWPAALYTPSDGRAEPFMAVPAIARAAQNAGATIHQQTAVRGIETEAGNVSSVVTENGVVKATSIVLAGGAWSRLFLGSIGQTFPQLTVCSAVMRTAPIKDIGQATLWGPGFATRRRQDGGYTIANGSVSIVDIVPDSFRFMKQFRSALVAERRGLRFRIGGRFVKQLLTPTKWSLDKASPFEKIRVYDPSPDRRMLAEAVQNLQTHIPDLAAAEIKQSWAGYIDVTPDAVPVISPIPDLSGMFLATGFSGHGFGIGPGAGKLMAELVLGEKTCVDPAPFRYSRFFDGSPMRLTSEV
jgi:glycine/D-amino acid oxidase-like deaminating enzyme